MTIDLLKQNLITAAEIKDAAERVKAYRGVLTDAIDYIYESTNTHKPEKASLLELVDSDVLANYVQDSDVINSLHYVRILGMNAEHDQKIKKTADKLAYDNLAYFIGLIEAQEKGTRAQYQKPPYMSEANTRKLYIDLYLKEAGWDVLDTENVAIAGKAGIEIKVEGMVKEIKVHITPLLDSGLEGFDLSIAFDIRMLDIELSMLIQGNTGMATRDVKTVRQVAQYLLTEKASIPQVFAKAEQLKTLVSEQFWDAPSLEELEQLRVDVRDLMQFLDKSPKKQIDVNIDDTVEPSGYDGGDTIIDIRTYREKVLDYLIEHSDNEVIHKIQRLEPITNEDLKALEKILWEELGTKEEYEQTTDIDNLAVFVRSLIGLSQEAVNEKFGEYLNGNVLNAQQQEFIRAIINYVRENGDISREDLIEKSPFDNYDILTLFGDNITSVLTIVGILHDSVNVAA